MFVIYLFNFFVFINLFIYLFLIVIDPSYTVLLNLDPSTDCSGDPIGDPIWLLPNRNAIIIGCVVGGVMFVVLIVVWVKVVYPKIHMNKAVKEDLV